MRSSRSTARRHATSGRERPVGMLSPQGAGGQVMGVLGGIMLSSRFLGKTLAALPAVLLLFTAVSVANAQSFYSVPALSFTKVFAGANPLAQNLMLSSTGAAFNYTAVASTTDRKSTRLNSSHL